MRFAKASACSGGVGVAAWRCGGAAKSAASKRSSWRLSSTPGPANGCCMAHSSAFSVCWQAQPRELAERDRDRKASATHMLPPRQTLNCTGRQPCAARAVRVCTCLGPEWLGTSAMLWVDKHRPTSLDKMDYHKDLSSRLSSLVSRRGV